MTLHRADGLLTEELLQSVRLAVVGCGSVGGDIVANLPYNFGHIYLIDPEPLGVENIERHVLGRSCIGLPKVEGLKNFLIDKGVKPDRITTYDTSIQDVFDLLDVTHVVIAADEPLARRDLHQLVRERNIGSLTIGIYPKGTAGHVIAVPPFSDACGMCGEVMLGFDETSFAHIAPDYGLSLDEQMAVHHAPVAIPALHAAVEAVANMAARAFLDMIKEELTAPELMIHANSAWEPVLRLKTARPEVEKLVNWVTSQHKLGLVSRMRLQPAEPGYVNLLIRNTAISLKLERSVLCPFHTLVGSEQV